MSDPDNETPEDSAPADRDERIRQRADEILKKLSDDEVSAEDARWIDSVHRLIEIRRHAVQSAPRPRLNSHALITLVCVLLGGLLLVIRVGDLPAPGFVATNNVSIALEVRALTVELAAATDPDIVDFGEVVVADRLAVDGLDTVTVSNAPIALHDAAGGLSVDISTDTIWLEAIELPGEPALRIERSGDSLSLAIDDSAVSIAASFERADFREPVALSVESDGDLDIPMFARFESSDGRVHIRLRQQDATNMLAGKAVTSLAFTDRYVQSADLLRHVSTVRSGQVDLLDVGRTVDLHARDHFVLDGVTGWIVEFDASGDGIEMLFKGTARKIVAGPEGTARDLRPNLLEYIMRNQPLALFWGGILFLWGMLNGIVKTLRG